MADAPNGNATFSKLSTVLTSSAAALALLVSLIAFFVKIANLETASINQQARIDRIDTAMNSGSDRNSKTREDVVALQRDLIEIETQECSQDNMRNLNHANDLRIMAMLWKKTFGDDLPIANTFYPRIGRCVATPR